VADLQLPQLDRPALFDTGVWTWVRDRRFPELATWFNAGPGFGREREKLNWPWRQAAITAGSRLRTCFWLVHPLFLLTPRFQTTQSLLRAADVFYPGLNPRSICKTRLFQLDQLSGSRNACSKAIASTPCTLTTLFRDFLPPTTLTFDGAIPIRFAIIRHRALFALPSTGGAVTRASRIPSPIPIS
jgi:hypothetical protein